MLFREGRFSPSGLTEYLKLSLTLLGAIAQVALNITLSVLIGTGFRARGPWAFFLAICLSAAWAAAFLLLLISLYRLVRYLNANQGALKKSRSALVLPLGAESLAVALGSAFLSGATVWIAKVAKESNGGLSDQERYGQFDIYFPITMAFQILALPSFVRLADIFGYAESKAKREVENVKSRSDYPKRKPELNSGSSRGSLISAESIRAAQKELDHAKARLEKREKNLASISTGASAQSLSQPRTHNRPLIPMMETARPGRREPLTDREDRLGRRVAADQDTRRYGQSSASRQDSDDQADTRIEMFSSAPARKSWFS